MPSDLIEVECHTLDHLEAQIPGARLIFMDVEGSEYSVLKGGHDYITTHSPILVMEAGPKQLGHHQVTLLDLYNELQSLNYSAFEITRFGLKRVLPDSFPSYTSNWLCIPEAKVESIVPRVKRMLLLCGFMPCVRHINPLCVKRPSDLPKKL